MRRQFRADLHGEFEVPPIDVDDKSRELIESCTDLGALNGWFRRAFKVGKARDLFEE